MGDLEDLWDEFMERFGRGPVWRPGQPMAVGDIGVIDKRGYIGLSNLAAHDIGFATSKSAVEPEYYVTSQRASSQDLGVHAHAGAGSGTVPVDVQAEMKVEFSGGSGFVLRAKSVRGEFIDDVLAVEAAIRQKNAVTPFWGKSWVYVQEVITAAPCVMALSTGASGSAVIGATTGPGTASTFGDLFGAGAKLSLDRATSSVHCVVANDRMPLMWRGRCRRGLFRTGFTDLGDEDDASAGDGAPADEVGLFEDFDDPSGFDTEILAP